MADYPKEIIEIIPEKNRAFFLPRSQGYTGMGKLRYS
jgi:hypothetical protein